MLILKAKRNVIYSVETHFPILKLLLRWTQNIQNSRNNKEMSGRHTKASSFLQGCEKIQCCIREIERCVSTTDTGHRMALYCRRDGVRKCSTDGVVTETERRSCEVIRNKSSWSMSYSYNKKFGTVKTWINIMGICENLWQLMERHKLKTKSHFMSMNLARWKITNCISTSFIISAIKISQGINFRRKLIISSLLTPE